MSVHRLHLVFDEDLGPALWGRVQTSPGRSRALDRLDDVLATAPPMLAEALTAARTNEGPLRHRIRLTSPSERRVPVLPLPGTHLLTLVGAVRDLIGERAADGDVSAALRPVLDAGSSLTIAPELVAMPDLLAAVIWDLHAQRLVEQRHLRICLVERFGETWAHWLPLDGETRPMLEALVDARARSVFARFAAPPETPAPTDHRDFGAHSGPGRAVGPGDPHGLVAALRSETPLRADIPAQRRIERALDGYVNSGRTRVRLQSTNSELVVRLFEPAQSASSSPGRPSGPGIASAQGTPSAPDASTVSGASSPRDTLLTPDAAWPLQTCLREADGTVHPVADLRTVGDVSVAGAAEASAEVMRLAPTVRDATVEDTGLDWSLTTAQASAFLSHDTPALEAAGVTVLLPRDWTKQRTTVRAQAEEPEPERNGTGVGIGAMTSFRWRVAVGDVDLTEGEMDEIRDAQAELVQLRGHWVRLDSTTLRAAERFLDAFSARENWRAGGRAPGATEDSADRSLSDRAGEPRADATEERTALRRADISDDGPRVELTWRRICELMLSSDAAGLDVELGHVLTPDGMDRNGIPRFLPGGPGPVPYPPPQTLRATLREYQLDGVNWLWAMHELSVGGILADDMGLGKTMQVLALLCREREDLIRLIDTSESWRLLMPASPAAGDDAHHRSLVQQHGIEGPLRPGPTLLVCPMSVVGSWQREARSFAPHLRVHVHHGGDRIRDDSFAHGAADTDLVITTYSLLDRDLAVLQQVAWQRVVFDEAQHLKNAGTAVTRSARRLPAQHRLALTGTPVENRLADLHSLMETVNPGMLGDAKDFQDLIASPIEKEGDGAALSRLRTMTGPFILRRVKTDTSIIRDLPDKIELTRSVNLSPEQAGLYEALVEELMTQIDGAEEAQRRTLVVSTLTKLKQVCNHPAHYLGDGSSILRDGQHRSGKLEFVDDLLETAFADGEKVLLFTQFTAFGRMLVPYWEQRFGHTVPFLHGGVAKKDRDAMVADFQQHPDRPGAMLLSLRAGGTGLTLTAANHVVHLDRWWNPAVENQATDRAFRIGQSKDVQVRKLVAAGTVEERIDRVLQDKQFLSDLTIAPGEESLGDLDDDALFDLLHFDDEDGDPGTASR